MPTDEEIRLRLAIDAKNALDNLDVGIKKINELKSQLNDLAKKGKASLDEVAKAMKQTFAEQKIANVPTSGTKKDIASATKAANAEIKEYNALVNQALKQIKAEQDAEAKQFAAREKLKTQIYKEQINERIASEKQLQTTVSEIEKQKLKESEKISKDRAKADKLAAQEQLKARQISFKPEDFPIVKNLQAAQTQVKNLKQLISEYASQSGASFKEVGNEILKNAKAAGMVGEQYKQLQKNVGAAVTSLNKASTAGKAFAGVGKIIQNAFSFFLGGSIFMALSRLFSGFQELVKVGEDYAQTIYRLAVSINQLQRRGLDITIRSEIALIKELRGEYETFSQKGVIEAITAVQMLTRNFGFSQEEIRKTTELSMDLALVQGKDVAETAKQLALFYSSGYGEGLQHAGLAVNRLTVANEAHRMGLKKSYMQLTETERAQAAYNLVTRQTVDLHNDAMKIQDTIIGQIKEQRAGIEDVTNEIALRALPIELMWLKVKLAFVMVLNHQIDAQDAYWESVKKVAKEQGKVYDDMSFLEQQKFLQKYREEIMKGTDEEIANKKAQWEKMLSGTLDVDVDTNIDLSSEDQDLADARAKLGEQIIELYADLEDAQKDYSDKSEELEQDHMNKLEEIDAESLEKQRELWKEYQEDILDAREDYADDLEDIERDLARDIAESNIDYQRELQDIDRDYRRGIQDANRKYRDGELKAERDYQEKLRRLREEYLFDLEDALRARDALQTLRLMRRYALDKAQAEREKDQNKQDRSEEYQRELEDLRRQAEQKKQDAQRQLQQEIADAQLAAQRKREDAQRALDEQLADARIAYEKAREDALAAAQLRREDEEAEYAKRQEELDADLALRKEKILAAFGEEIGITGTSLKTVSDIFTKYFGAKGVVPKTINNYIKKINESAEETSDNTALMEGYLNDLANSVEDSVNRINTSLSTLNWSSLSPIQQVNQPVPYDPNNPYSIPPKGSSPPRKAGGATDWMLTRPQLFMAGEVPEMLNIMPLSQLNSNKIDGVSSGKNGKAQIEILLGRDLEGKIVDRTLNEVDVILTRELSKK